MQFKMEISKDDFSQIGQINNQSQPSIAVDTGSHWLEGSPLGVGMRLQVGEGNRLVGSLVAMGSRVQVLDSRVLVLDSQVLVLDILLLCEHKRYKKIGNLVN